MWLLEHCKQIGLTDQQGEMLLDFLDVNDDGFISVDEVETAARQVEVELPAVIKRSASGHGELPSDSGAGPPGLDRGTTSSRTELLSPRLNRRKSLESARRSSLHGGFRRPSLTAPGSVLHRARKLPDGILTALIDNLPMALDSSNVIDMFKLLDRDRSGRLDRDEFVAQVVPLLGIEETQAAQMFDHLDSSGDGVIGVDEFIRLGRQTAQLRAEQGKELPYDGGPTPPPPPSKFRKWLQGFSPAMPVHPSIAVSLAGLVLAFFWRTSPDTTVRKRLNTSDADELPTAKAQGESSYGLYKTLGELEHYPIDRFVEEAEEELVARAAEVANEVRLLQNELRNVRLKTRQLRLLRRDEIRGIHSAEMLRHETLTDTLWNSLDVAKHGLDPFIRAHEMHMEKRHSEVDVASTREDEGSPAPPPATTPATAPLAAPGKVPAAIPAAGGAEHAPPSLAKKLSRGQTHMDLKRLGAQVGPWTTFVPVADAPRRVKLATRAAFILFVTFLLFLLYLSSLNQENGLVVEVPQRPLALSYCQMSGVGAWVMFSVAVVITPVCLVLIARAFRSNVNWGAVVFLIYAYNVWAILLQTMIRTVLIIGAYSAPADTIDTTAGAYDSDCRAINVSSGVLDYGQEACLSTTILLALLHVLVLVLYMLTDLLKAKGPWLRLWLGAVLALEMQFEITARTATYLPQEHQQNLFFSDNTQDFVLNLDLSVLSLMVGGFMSTVLRPESCAFILLPCRDSSALFFYRQDRRTRRLLGMRRYERLALAITLYQRRLKWASKRGWRGFFFLCCRSTMSKRQSWWRNQKAALGVTAQLDKSPQTPKEVAAVSAQADVPEAVVTVERA